MTSRQNGHGGSSRLHFISIAALAVWAGVIPASAASNGKIAFASGRSGPQGIWVMNPDGTGATSVALQRICPLILMVE
jgi:hypothetical protein